MTRAARVVPDVATFAVDDGFWYSIPQHLDDDLDLGSIVRVPLSGRRVRGWVVEVAESRPGNLKEIGGISGYKGVFDARLLEGLQWASRHYIAPVPVLLGRATPPNLPRKLPGAIDVPSVPESGHQIGDLAKKSAVGARSPVMALVGNWRRMDWLADVGALLESGSSALVVAASAAEVHEVGAAAVKVWGDLVALAAGDDDKGDTEAWEAAQSPPRLVIGTPKTAAWRIERFALAVVLEEGRRAMKDRQTPTIHVRELLRTRSRLEGFNLVFFGPTPSVELLSAGADVVREGSRAWALVEVVDRSEDQPGSGFLSARVLSAISAMTRSGARVFIFTHRRTGYGSMRCTSCRTLRSCSNCGTRLARVDACPRCHRTVGPCSTCGGNTFEEMGTVPERLVAEITRKLGVGSAEVHPSKTLVTVGTERDLAGLPPVTLAVAADVDGMLTGVSYRSSEEALRQLARLALAVGEGRGARLMLQTSRPDSLLVTTLRRGDPIPYLERVLIERARSGAPPAAEMIAIEIRGEVPDTVASDLAALAGAVVLGPMILEEGRRWLLSGQLGPVRFDLRRLVARWRDAGLTVRVDADPIDV